MVKKRVKKEEPQDWYADFDGDEELFVGWINNQVEKHPVFLEKHGKWKELIAWENGEQFSEWNEKTGEIKPVVLKKRKKLVVINMMKPLTETIDGKLNYYHSLIGSPNSSEAKDITASKVSTKFIKYNDEINRIDTLMDDMKYDELHTGNGWILWEWDTNAFGYAKGDDGKQKVVKGELIGRVPSVFDIRPDPTVRDWKDMRWFIELMEVSLDDLKKSFKDIKDSDLEELDESDVNKAKGRAEPEAEKPKGGSKLEKTYIIKKFRQKKNYLFPKGRLAFVTKNKVLWVGPNRNPDTKLGLFFFGYKRYGNSFWHTGPLHHVQSIQREFNRMVSLESEHYEGWRAKMLLPKGSLTRKGSFTTDSFELLEYDPRAGVAPSPANMPVFGAEKTAYRDFLIGAFDKVSNIHEVSYARLPQYASRAPAQLYGMMLEQEDVKLNPMLKRMNETLKDMARFRLQMMEQYYTEERMVKIMGEGERTSVEYFRGADLRGNHDVRIEVGVSLNQSSTVQQRLLMELYEAGMLPPEMASKMLKYMNLGTAEYDLRSDIVDDKRAIRENQMFLNGRWKEVISDRRFTIDMPVPPTPENPEGMAKLPAFGVYMHDDHALHLGQHSTLAKSEEAEQFDEKTWEALQMHMKIHHLFEQALKEVPVEEGMPAEEGAPVEEEMPPEETMPPTGGGM